MLPPYRIVRSDRKTVGLQITPQGVLVRAPRGVSDAQIQKLLTAREPWIQKHLARIRERQPQPERLTDDEMQALRERAGVLIPARVAYYAAQIGVSYGRITIRCQRTRWGSCSSAGNLNFNCLLLLAPPRVLDSVVVHELCHRKQMNHSAAFYREVYRVFPDYDRCRLWLRENGGALLARARADV